MNNLHIYIYILIDSHITRILNSLKMHNIFILLDSNKRKLMPAIRNVNIKKIYRYILRCHPIWHTSRQQSNL